MRHKRLYKKQAMLKFMGEIVADDGESKGRWLVLVSSIDYVTKPNGRLFALSLLLESKQHTPRS